MTIQLEEQGKEAVLGLTVSGKQTSNGASTTSSDQELSQRLGLGIARAIFEATGGNLTVEHGVECRSVEMRRVGR